MSVYQTGGSDGDRQVGVCPVFVVVASACKLYRLRTTSFGVVFHWVRHTRKGHVIDVGLVEVIALPLCEQSARSSSVRRKKWPF